ncbi:MAG: hypothetical protein ABL996_21415, partial [Micropepsaceae bacterium]
MDSYFLVFVLGVVVGSLTGVWVVRRSDRAAQPPVTPPSEPVPAVAAEEPLSAKLHRLGQPLESFGDNTAHPRELADRSEFGEAVALLSQSDVALDVVVEYALGANWTLSCAALKALGQRADGEQASAEVVSRVGNLRPWAIHFALEYFTALKNRPAAGAPA